MPKDFWAGVGTWYKIREQDSLLPASASCPALLAPSPAFLSPVFLFQVPAIEENLLDDKHLLKPWDAKKVSRATGRPPLPSALLCVTALEGFSQSSVSHPFPLL